MHGRFGHSADLANGVLVIGSIASLEPGCVYAFTRSGGLWVERQKLSASDSHPYDSFGESLCVDGETVAVGAPYHDHSGMTDPGAVYLLRLRSLASSR